MEEAYLFEEDDRASTQTAEQIYLHELDDSHVCIFLIDNADGIFDGVTPEIQRAKAKGIKSIYIFNKENSTEPTWVQKDLYGAKGTKFYEIFSFADFASEAYNSLISDIIDIYYKYCRKWLVDSEFETKDNPLKEVGEVGSEAFQKCLISNIDHTKIHLSSIVFDNHRKEVHTSAFDDCCKKFLEVILGEKDFRDFNVSIILMELIKMQSPELHSIVDLRWKAITAYYMDNLEDCIKYFNQALVQARDNGASAWLISDILIDLRNTSILSCNTQSSLLFVGEAQKALNEQNEPVYYPLLDRINTNFYEELEKSRNKEMLQSPYTQNIGNNIDKISDYIASIFAVAVFNGSLTHILMTHDRLKHFAFYLSKAYDDWSFRVLLLKYTALSSGREEMIDTLKAFNEIQGKINAFDSLNIFNVSKCIPISYKRFIIQLSIFESIGYFFSDDDYTKIGVDLIKQISDWISSESPNVLCSTNVLKMLQANHLRLDNNKIIGLCLVALRKRHLRFWDDVFKLLITMGVEKVADSLKEDLINIFVSIINAPEDRDNCSHLEQALISIRKTGGDYAKTLDAHIEKNMSGFYKGVYSLEIFSSEQGTLTEYVVKYIHQIDIRNAEQGVNGIYYGYTDNPYTTIRNIIKDDLSILNYDLVNQILAAIKNTLLAARQTLKDKSNAIKLAAFLRNVTTSEHDELFRSFETTIQKAEAVALIGQDVMFSKCSSKIIQLEYFLFLLACGFSTSGQVVTICSSYSDAEDYECIEALSSFADFFEMVDINKVDRNVLYPLLAFALSFCKNKSYYIRFYAISTIIKMLAPDTFSPIISQLSISMDFEILNIKCKIIRHIEDIRAFDPEAAEGILQKAKSDTNFIVRRELDKI
jgi:hypothetical protein